MASSLTASLLLLSVVFMQFVSAADQNNFIKTAEPGNDLILPCKDPDQGRIIVIEWSRTDLGPESVLTYRNFQFEPAKQHQSYKDRVDLLVGEIRKGDVSLILKNPTTDISGTYQCRVVKENRGEKLISTISLQV
uniref:Ig-like domain-containing protein n=2 Tax=Poecilia formosa TaxID=48698 RepID=A0A096LZ71_POEFO